VFAVAAVLAVAAVVGAITMERRALAASVDEKTAAVETMVAQTVRPILVGADLTKPVGDTRSQDLTRELDKSLSGPTVRVRIYAKDGRLLYSTDEGDRVGSAKTGDDDAIRGAAVGASTSIVDEDRVSLRGAAAQSLKLLQVYAPIEDGGKTTGVAEFDLKYKPMETASKQPWRIVQLGAGFLAILFLELSLFGLARATATKRLAARSGFAAPPSSRSSEAKAAGAAPKPGADAKAAEKEAEIRKALEDQLSTLRTQVKKQEEDSAIAAREFADQLKAAATRAEQAEQRVQAAGNGGEQARAAVERAGQLEQQLRQMEHQQQSFQSRIAELEARLAEAERRTAAAEQRADEAEAQLAEGGAAAPVAAVAAVDPTSPLDEAAATVRAASPEDARGILAEAAKSLFPSVVAGQVKGSDVADVLVAAATEVGIDEEEARRAIAAAFVARRTA
jgi:hypothetical protein